jgi:hypothetical protein
MRARNSFIPAVAIVVALAAPSVANGAFNGYIDADSGHPGDRVTVTSADGGPFIVGATGLFLLPAVDSARDERDLNCAAEQGSRFLGQFERRGSGARVVFVVPTVAPGRYEVRMDVPDATPSCWWLGDFEVLQATPATDTAPSPGRDLLSVTVSIVTGILAGWLLLASRAKRVVG